MWFNIQRNKQKVGEKMFKDKENYKEYLEKQKVEIPYFDESNYFQHSENGEIILKKQDCNIS